VRAVILAGGYGTRISEETTVRPKPMIEIGGQPILWHIMKIYAAHGIHEFVIALGYKGYVVKEYFANYALHRSDVTFKTATGELTVHGNTAEPWEVTLVDTGEGTMTGGRIKRLQRYLEPDAPFCMTYGDGVGNVDITAQRAQHALGGVEITMTVVQPPGRFGSVALRTDRVEQFQEKPQGDNAWVNGGFFIIEPSVLDLIDGDASVFEHGPLEHLAANGKLGAFRHTGFWQPLDTLRDKTLLENLWDAGNAPWKLW
jgi:glucose-1-phosphate cytidylyltransferase